MSSPLHGRPQDGPEDIEKAATQKIGELYIGSTSARAGCLLNRVKQNRRAPIDLPTGEQGRSNGPTRRSAPGRAADLQMRNRSRAVGVLCPWQPLVSEDFRDEVAGPFLPR